MRRVLQRYIQKETECILSGKANVSATTQANRQKKMQEISSLVKYFIRCANKRGPRLKCSELLSHVMNILQNSYTCSAYGADYSSILLKDILSVRKYWCEINQKQWADLLELYCKLYRKSCKDIDRVLLARIIFTLVRGCCLQTEGVTHSLFNFFSKSLPEARRVCALGEEILPTIMYVWSQRRPQDHLKEEIVEFFSIQLHVHHPKGAKTEETGAYADDWSKWQSLLYSLYDAIASELNQIGSRGKYSTGFRPIAVKENIVELMADICHQLFTQDSRILEITQSTAQRETHHGVANKRRRIDIGWEVIRDKLQISQSDFDIIPCFFPNKVDIMDVEILDCESLFLHSTFDEVPGCFSVEENVDKQSTTRTSVHLITGLKEKLEQYLLIVAEHLLNRYFPNSQSPQAECLLRCVSLLTGVLSCYIVVGVVTEEDACKTILFQKSKMTRKYEPSMTIQVPDDVNVSRINNQVEMDFFDDDDGCSRTTDLSEINDNVDLQCGTGANNALSEEHLTKQDFVYLDALKFLCLCASSESIHGLSFRPVDIRRKLLSFIDQLDNTKPVHLHTFKTSCTIRPFSQFEFWARLRRLLMSMMDYFQSLVQLCSAYNSEYLSRTLSKDGRSTASVRAALAKCMIALLEGDPQCHWSIFNMADEDIPISDAFPQFLADSDHEVRMLTAMSVNRLFLEFTPKSCGKMKLLPLTLQQKAFENVYLKAQEGIGFQKRSMADEFEDEQFNRKATLLKVIYVVLCCSPVCEKQALFALFQSFKENKIDLRLIKKVLSPVSKSLNYRNVKHLISSHLDYLVTEWLRQKDDGYSLQAFPYALLEFSTLDEFYRSCYNILVPHLVFLEDFEQVKAIGKRIERDWKELLADCFPKIMVNILPCFAIKKNEVGQQREKASKVYDILQEDTCMGKQRTNLSFQKNIQIEKIQEFSSMINCCSSREMYAVNRPAHLDEVSTRSFSLCCDLLSSVCQNALKYCGDALENHLQVIVGTLTPTVTEQSAVRQQVLRLLKFLVIEGKENENLYNAVRMLEPFPDVPLFKELRAAQHKVKYSRGPFTLEEEIKHFLSVSSCDSLPITRLEGLIDLKKQLQLHKEQMRELLKESQVDPQDSILLKLIRKLLQLCKTAVGHSGSRDILEAAGSCLGEVGPVDFATVALFHNKDYLNSKAEDLFQEKEFQWLYVILHSINNALTDRNSACGTVFDNSFWLELNYFEVAIAAQSCAADFTALLYSEIYVDKIRSDYEESQRNASKVSRRILFEESSQSFTITSLSEKSREETGKSLQALQNFGLCNTLLTYLKGLEYENTDWGTELQEIRFQAAWRNMQWDYTPSASDETVAPGYHESLHSALQSLQNKEISAFHDNLKYARTVTEAMLNNVYNNWQQQSKLLQDSDFSFQEPVMALRTVIQEALIEKEASSIRKEYLKSKFIEHLMEFSKCARFAGNTQLAERAIFQIKQHTTAGLGSPMWKLEEAQMFWARKEEGLALGILRKMIHNLADEAVEVIGGSSDSNDAQLQSSKMKASLSLARFSDAQYQSIENYMKSSEFENKRALLEKAKQEVGLMKVHRVETSKYTIKIERELELDEKALCNQKEDRIRFLCKAVENYINCLEFGEEHDVWVFRLCSLWLENSAVSEVNSMVKNGIRKIPSYKFLPLMYQLAARMGSKMPGAATEGDGFHDVLNEVICRTSIDHPHHTLFIILALVNANKDDTFRRSEGLKKSGLSKHAPKQTSLLDKERSEVAQEIVNVIRKEKAKMVKNVEILCEAYISLANMDASRWKTEKNNIVLSKNVMHDFLILIKLQGQDDLRQDAVMQQVFQMCNMLLLRNTETRKRKLTIRRYKVVPFSQRSGVLEWCTGTVPIGEYLIDPSKGAHKRYRPDDWSSMEVVKKTFEDKLNTYLEVCQNFKPVFRYFCMERFLDPAVWLERRLAYTRSVATSSIGVAFEQGKILPTPETVPFRLSRDIVDGMGITGVEGVFRSDTQNFNKVAERVLLRLHEKLKGVEEGAVLSVGGQVNLLIQQAMDPKNLSRLFPGWQPWI
ncbi:ATM kinase, partial [Polypterus senegalus]